MLTYARSHELLETILCFLEGEATVFGGAEVEAEVEIRLRVSEKHRSGLVLRPDMTWDLVKPQASK